MTNARSVLNKKDELEYFVKQNHIDIIGVTETWATNMILDSEMSTENFSLYRHDRDKVRSAKGGGVLLYVNELLSVLPDEDLNSDECESLWLRLYTGKNKFTIIGICYKSPTASLDEVGKLFEQIKKASNFQSVILGDFNYPGINWETGEAKSLADQQFFELINDCFFLIQHVRTPTRGGNVLDLILTTEINMIENLVVMDPLGKSDHNTLVFDLVTQTYNYKEQNTELYLSQR